MSLRTPHLSLRPLSEADAAAVHELRREPAVMAYWDSPPDLAPNADVFAWHLSEIAEGRACYWIVEREVDGEVVGLCDISEIDRRHRRAEVGYMLAEPFWGQGYGSEAMAAVVEHARGELDLKRLTARVHLGNVASIALLKKLGFEQEGILRGFVERDGARRDCALFGLLL
jgi:ribosomal-protein-alanine N-acetyltransferase